MKCVIEKIKKQLLKMKLKSRCRTGGADIDKNGVSNRADTQKKKSHGKWKNG